MNPIQFVASLHRIAKDREGEVTVTLKVPKREAGSVMTIAEETPLTVRIEEAPS